MSIPHIILFIVVPVLFVSTVLYVFLHQEEPKNGDKKYQVRFKLRRGKFQIENIKRGASIIGSAGSGKTESVIYNFLQHFSTHQFCGIIHDYKDFELTEIAYPLFKEKDIKFYTIAFDVIHYRVNPIDGWNDLETKNVLSSILHPAPFDCYFSIDDYQTVGYFCELKYHFPKYGKCFYQRNGF